MRILQVVHGFPPDAAGGTEIYTRHLAAALAAMPGNDVAVLTREADAARPELALRRRRSGSIAVFGINNTFRACATFEESYQHPRLLAVACGVLDEFRPDVVHLQHLTCLSTRLPGEIARRGIPIVLTLNDYWLLCHRGQLLDLDGRRCGGPLDDGCARCIPASALPGEAARALGRAVAGLPMPGAARAVGLAARAFDYTRRGERTKLASVTRLAQMREAVAHADRVLAPSNTMASWFAKFGLGPDRLARCEQGIPLQPFSGLRRAPSPVLRVGFAGGLIPSKAPHVLLDAIDLLPPGALAVDLLGSGGAYHGRSDYADRLTRRLGHRALRRTGPVPHERMPDALHDVDIVVVPSVWIENAPFIIREAFAAGAPVVASDLGGMAEMVRHGIDGLLFPPGDAAALARQLRRLIEEPGLLERLRAGIRPPMSIEDDAARLLGIYSGLAAGHATKAARTTGAVPPRPAVAAAVLNFGTPEQTWLAVRSLQTSFRIPDRILVVDNGSRDGSVDALKASLAGVEILANPINLGFSGGCNLAIRAALDAGAEYILLVNSDVVLAPDALGALLAHMEADPRIGIAGPLLRSRQEPGLVASAGISYSRHTGRMRQLSAGDPSTSAAEWSRGVDAISGCVMLIRRAVFERIGLLDEAYFFSFEDIDFCLRAADAGFRSACVRGAAAYHEGGGTIGHRSAERVYFATRNHLRLQAWSGPRASRPLRTALVIALNAAYVVSAPEAPLLPGLAAVVRGARDYLRGTYRAG